MAVTINGKTEEQLGIKVILDTQVPVLSQTRDRIVTIPGKHGAYDFGADLEPRNFELNCVIDETSPTKLQEIVRGLAAEFTSSDGTPKTVQMKFDVESEKYYNVRYSGSLPIERIARVGLFQIPLTAYDPYAFSNLNAYDETYEYDSGQSYDSGLIYPNERTVHDWSFLSPNHMLYMGEREWAGFVWTYSRHMSSQYNHSNYKTPLIVEISGNVTNPKITNANNDQFIQINTTLSNQKLVIDGENMTITIDGNNAMQYLADGDFIDMEPGDNGFFFDGVNPYAHVTYMWEHRFL